MSLRKQDAKIGMWAAISTAVQAGWRETLRLILVLGVMGAIVLGASALYGGAHLLSFLKALPFLR